MTPAFPEHLCNPPASLRLMRPMLDSAPPAHIYNYAARVMYDGTDFCGWQLQQRPQGKPSVQKVIEAALLKKQLQPDRDALRMQASSRTDSGVHAECQVINFFTRQPIEDPAALVYPLNSTMPPDVQFHSIKRVSPDFSARYSTVSKTYHYQLQTGPACSPILRRFSIWKPDLDLDLFRQTAAIFEGSHNFMHFSNTAGPLMGRARDPVKVITACSIHPEPWGLTFKVTGRGFLYRMVRHMCGAAIAVGLCKTSLDHVQDLLLGGPEKRTGPRYRGWDVAPPQGLCLQHVEYPPPVHHTEWLHPSYDHDENGRVLQTKLEDADLLDFSTTPETRL